MNFVKSINPRRHKLKRENVELKMYNKESYNQENVEIFEEVLLLIVNWPNLRFQHIMLFVLCWYTKQNLIRYAYYFSILVLQNIRFKWLYHAKCKVINNLRDLSISHCECGHKHIFVNYFASFILNGN